MKSNLIKFSTVLLLLSLFGCVTPFADDKELASLFEEYNKQIALQESKRKAQEIAGINTLVVEKSADGDKVSVDLDKASIPLVVHRVIDEAGIPYVFDTVLLNGDITAKFDSLPLLEALNLFLSPVMLAAEFRDGIVVISQGAGDKSLPPSKTSYAEVPLKNIGLDTATTLLDGLYPRPLAPQEPARLINFGPLTSSNTMFLNGPKAEILNAAKILLKADQSIKHVMIEVVLIEFDSNDLEKVGSELANLVSGNYSGVNLNFGSFANDSINFSFASNSNAANNPLEFTALLDFLISEEKARLISRPYVATLSGKQANITIATDRYVITQIAENGAAITAPVPISSGVILKITPTVLPDDSIRMEISVEDSQFGESSSNVAVEVNKNTVETVMQVDDKQSIIIGGLVLNRRSWKKAGVPILRDIPLLNVLFSKQSNDVIQREVAIYVTPHLWDPNMKLPIVNADALKN